MKYLNVGKVLALLLISLQSNAALVERLGGLAYYDTDADLTWLADANYAVTTGYDADGLMNWYDANLWVSNLNVGGIGDWRLPYTLQPDPSCSFQTASASYGYSCTGSELGNLFHNVLGNLSYYDSNMVYQPDWGLSNTGPFSNVQARYWSETVYAPYTENAWGFNVHTGYQVSTYKTNDKNLYAWAVRSGDVAVVPVPPAIWLLLSGLIGMAGVGRRRLSQK